MTARMIVHIIAAGLILAVEVAIWTHGYRSGKAVVEAQHAAELARAREEAFEAAELASRKEEDRLAVERERDRLAQELEDAAYADPVAHPQCLSADRVRRINSR